MHKAIKNVKVQIRAQRLVLSVWKRVQQRQSEVKGIPRKAVRSDV